MLVAPASFYSSAELRHPVLSAGAESVSIGGEHGEEREGRVGDEARSAWSGMESRAAGSERWCSAGPWGCAWRRTTAGP